MPLPADNLLLHGEGGRLQGIIFEAEHGFGGGTERRGIDKKSAPSCLKGKQHA